MEPPLICLAVALVGGLMPSRLTKRLHLPAVTAYLVSGLILGPFCLGALGVPGLGFNSLGQVEGLSIITQTALGFIAFTIGNEFRLSQLKAMGSYHHYRHFAGSYHHRSGRYRADRFASNVPGGAFPSCRHHVGRHRLGNSTGRNPDGRSAI